MIKAFLIAGAIGATLLLLIAGGSVYEGGVFRSNTNPSDWVGEACWLKDEEFNNISTPLTASEVQTKLGSNYHPDPTKIQQIIDDSKKAGINPAILISFWGAEQTFGNPDEAFGCGVYGGKNRAPGFSNQIKCALSTIKDAINNTGYYTKPEDENIWTRLLYNYVGARKEFYDKNGFVSGPNENRIKFLKLLVPNQVECVNNAPVTNTRPYDPVISGDIIANAKNYLGHGIYYSQKGNRCGPKTLGPAGVVSLDCSSYVWRVYRDSGATSSSCWFTATIVTDSKLTKIANDADSGKKVARPGDIIIYGNRTSSGAYIHDNKKSHAAIYAGNGDIYETSSGGPKLSPGRAWEKHKAPVFGVYRAK